MATVLVRLAVGARTLSGAPADGLPLSHELARHDDEVATLVDAA
jgi:hypothetical protein